MKSTIKIFVAFVMVLGFAVGAKAQVTGAIEGKAKVASAIQITDTKNLDFDIVTAGHNKTVGFADDVTAGIASTGEKTGHFTIKKSANTSVTLKFTLLPDLLLTTVASGHTSNQKIGITYSAQLSDNTETTPPTPVNFPTGAPLNVANSSSTIPFFATDEFQVDLGGTVTVLGTQEAGDYKESIVLTATYN